VVELEPWHSFYCQRWQICTGDGWASQIARPLFQHFQPSGAVDPVAAVFFVLFVILVGWTLLSVVVAVLLENFIQASWAEREETERETKRARVGKSVAIGPLDPLLLKMVHYRSTEDLHKLTLLVFEAMDVLGTGYVEYGTAKCLL